jgi:L-2-hydroxyglutarate oxidase LhgO
MVECRPEGIVLDVSGTEPTTLMARTVINAAGLSAQLVASRFEGLARSHIPRGYYARGHYFVLEGRSPFRHLVYPVAGGGGLGVHLTLDLAGQARFGPDVEWVDDINYEFDASRLPGFVAAIRRYYPGLSESRLSPGYVGIRPKVVGPNEPAGDFVISTVTEHGVPGLVNLYGIESPGLTASLAIAERVVGLAK